jgi:hypothetical protein
MSLKVMEKKATSEPATRKDITKSTVNKKTRMVVPAGVIASKRAKSKCVKKLPAE